MSRKQLISLVLVGAALCVGAAIIGRSLGEDAGAESLERLTLVWPDFQDMPESDRALVAGLAWTCQVDRGPATQPAVVACLREAARDPEAMLPTGVSATDVPARLEQLLPADSRTPLSILEVTAPHVTE